MESRLINPKVALDQVPSMMRAVGVYLSEREIEDLLNEIRYGTLNELGELVNSISLHEFIQGINLILICMCVKINQ